MLLRHPGQGVGPRTRWREMGGLYRASRLRHVRHGSDRVLLLTEHEVRRRVLAEFTGSAMLVTVVVGSGLAAAQLSPNDVVLQLLENSTATVLGLTVLILLFGPVSGAHFNPVVSLVDWWLGRRSGAGISGPDLLAYSVVQLVGGIAGALLANVMFDRRIVELPPKARG